MIQGHRTKTLQPYDKLLRAFKYFDALDEVLKRPFNPVVIVSMLDELVHRDGVRSALANRDENTLEPLLVFLHKYISNPKYSSRLIDVSNILLGINLLM